MQEVIARIHSLAPPTKKVPPETLGIWISLAEEFVCRKSYGEQYEKALALYTLHIMTLDGALKSDSDSMEDMSRRVTSFSITGEVSEHYGRVSEGDGTFLDQTPWGKILQAMKRKKGKSFALLTGARRRVY